MSMKYKGIGIYSTFYNLEIVNGSFYGMLRSLDNSAPCANCAFYTSDYGIICSHPNKKQRKCKHESGSNKGWNTTEYVEIPKEYVVEYE